MILSSTGSGRPLIHDAGFLLQADSCYDPRIAIHKQAGFQAHREQIESALRHCGVRCDAGIAHPESPPR